MKLFISYGRANKKRVEELQQVLEQSGHDAWFDQEITAGDNWWVTILRSIEKCDVFVFALSPESTASIACQAEYQYALDLNKPILPVMLSEAELPVGSLRETQYVDATRGFRNNDVVLALSRALFRMQERILKGDFIPTDPPPPRPEFPFPPDPLEEIRNKVPKIGQLSESELIHIIFHIRQVAALNTHVAQESRQILTRIIAGTNIPPEVKTQAREALQEIEPQFRRRIFIGAAVTFGVILVALIAFVLVNASDLATFYQRETEVAQLVLQLSHTPTMTDTVTPDTVTPDTVTPSETPELTDTLEPTSTPTDAATSTPTTLRDAIIATQTAAAMVTPSETPTDAPTSTRTPAVPPTPLATIAMDNVASLVDTQIRFEGHNSTIRALNFSHNGLMLGSASSDNTARVWDAATGALIMRAGTHSDWVTDIVFTHDDANVITSSRDGSVRFWNIESGLQTDVLLRVPVWDLALSSGGTLLAMALNDGTIELYDMLNGETLLVLTGHEAPVRALDFNRENTLLVSGGQDDTVRIWDTLLGENIRTLEGHQRDVYAVEFSPDGSLIASGSADGVARVWDTLTGERLYFDSGDIVWSLTFSPDGQLLLIASNNQTVRVWDFIDDEMLNILDMPATAARSVAISPRGDFIAAGGGEDNSVIRLWRIQE